MSRGPHAPSLASTLTSWLHEEALQARDLSHMCQLLWRHLSQTDLHVERLNLGVFLMHPELAGVAYLVSSGDEVVKVVEVPHAALRSDVYLQSPIRLVVEGAGTLRFRLNKLNDLEFPVLLELYQDGFSDYVVVPLNGPQGRVHVVSIATRSAEGFHDSDVEAFRSFCRSFGLLVDSLTVYTLAEVLLRLYVGPMTAPRVLRGEVRLGRGETIQAAILYSDLRGFSGFCNRHGATATIDVLNRYLSAISASVEELGGEVIKLMGDAMLAVFPIDGERQGSRTEAARKCLEAARASRRRLSHITFDEADEPLQAGFGLTLGEVIYGNIGAPGRLDFTVIGDAVNLAARLEALSKTESVDLLMGPAFMDALQAPVQGLGQRHLKGFDAPVEVYALSPGDHH